MDFFYHELIHFNNSLAIIGMNNVTFGIDWNEDILATIFKLCALQSFSLSGLENECEPETKYEDNNFC